MRSPEDDFFIRSLAKFQLYIQPKKKQLAIVTDSLGSTEYS